MKTEILDIIQRIIRNDVDIEVQNNSIKLKLPKAFCDEELIDKLKIHKSDMITFFEKVKSQNLQKIKKAEKKEFYYAPSVIKGSWILNQLIETTILQNCIQEHKNLKDINIEILKKSIEILVNRHEILKTTFPVIKDRICQFIMKEGFLEKILKIFYIQNGENYDEAYEKILQNAKLYRFDFCSEPLIKISIIQKTNSDIDIIVCQDHAITDTSSHSIIYSELFHIYSKLKLGQEIGLEPLKFQYKDYSEWYKSYKNGNESFLTKLYFKNQLKTNVLPKNLKDIFSIQTIDNENDSEKKAARNLISEYFSKQMEQQVHEELYHATKVFPYDQISAYFCRFFVYGSLFNNLIKFSSELKCTLGTISLISFALVNNILTDEKEFIFSQPVNIRMNDTMGLCGNFVNLILIKANLELNMKVNEAIDAFNNHIFKSINHKQFHFADLVKELDLHPKKMTPFIMNNQSFDIMGENEDFTPVHVKVNWSAWSSIIVNIRAFTNGLTFDIIYDGKTFEKSFIERIFDIQRKVLCELCNHQNISFQDIIDKSRL